MSTHNSPSPSLLRLSGLLLRTPERIIGATTPAESEDPDHAGDRLAALAPRLLALIVFGAAIFGAVIGSYRGGLQYLYAAIKTPALLLLPVLVGLPAIRAFHDACELSVSWSRLALAALVAVARTAVLGVALAPVLWLYLSLHPDYHDAILAMAASLVAIGLPGLWTLAKSMPAGGRQRALAGVASVAVLGVLLAQSGWLLRPFVVRPRAEVSFLRPIEADVFSSLASTSRSARGDYRGWDARGAGLLGRDHGEPEAVEVEAPPARVEAPSADVDPRTRRPEVRR